MSVFLSNVIGHTRGEFLKRLLMIAIPIALQNIMFSSRGLVDVLMLGQLGEAEIAAVGVASRATFVTTIMLVGVTTGGALLTAQYWGAQNKEGVRQSTALTWMVSMAMATIPVALFFLIPEQIMSLATDSQEVIDLGADYLFITALTMYVVSCGSSMAVGLRSIHQPGVSTFFSGIGIVANVFFNWVLIFGNLGAPAMGIKGAALATLISGIIEIVFLYGYLYSRSHLLSFGIEEVKAVLNWPKISKFLSLSLPTTFNFLVWSAGIFAYHAIMGQSGVQGLAALSVISPIESIALSFLIGAAGAASVLIGNQLGAKKYEAVYYQSWGVLGLSVATSMVIALFVMIFQHQILDMFPALTTETRAIAEKFIAILAIIIVIRSVPLTAIVGVLRAGGDVKYCLYQDIVSQWFIGIPIAAVGALVLGLPPEYVYALFVVEEIVKWFGSIYRMKSKKWIKNLVDA
ncbi:MATE family efflux transporter [Aliivibrio finisterrensis]|uniref:MATE family efflux transporter n=1 Tax=Aliivibrio finisterrensis TaxID=511998 RepID=UPI0010206885|nr:MATE family efflux transporter [Aliivibrio finisterrensis]RYU71176.1 MATE family efflux transporter [Aliivibrio finisterrensis]RYU74905.1 MATE family efflux transporter [Aliivibrio finisterrensis]RYU77350.1 MATE family efflux transporter [Aliivibrio finisterrensis]